MSRTFFSTQILDFGPQLLEGLKLRKPVCLSKTELACPSVILHLCNYHQNLHRVTSTRWATVYITCKTVLTIVSQSRLEALIKEDN